MSSFSKVTVQVIAQILFPFECDITTGHGALEISLARVSRHVSLEMIAIMETAVTHRARKLELILWLVNFLLVILQTYTIFKY